MTTQFYARIWKIQAALLIMIFLISACTGLRLQTMPVPPASNKLRVFVQPISGNLPKGGWPVTHEVFSATMFEATKDILNKKDIYQVVQENDVHMVMGKQSTAGWQWEKNEWLLAKQAGKALYADYTFIIERGHKQYNYNRMVLVNTETGKFYEALYYIHSRRDKETISAERKKIIQNSFREIFQAAKADMLSTALKKGKVHKSPQSVAPEDYIENKNITSREEKRPVSRTSLALALGTVEATKDSANDELRKEINGERPHLSKSQAPADSAPRDVHIRDEISDQGKTKLVVYDFNAMENLRIVAMILAEALREELHQSGKFELINRENIGQVMEELKLQQTGLVDEKDAIRIGKWMSANETVTGNLSLIGNALILQAKRTDMKTMTTLSLGSLKTSIGKEEGLLEEMHRLAQILSK